MTIESMETECLEAELWLPDRGEVWGLSVCDAIGTLMKDWLANHDVYGTEWELKLPSHQTCSGDVHIHRGCEAAIVAAEKLPAESTIDSDSLKVLIYHLRNIYGINS